MLGLPSTRRLRASQPFNFTWFKFRASALQALIPNVPDSAGADWTWKDVVGISAGSQGVPQVAFRPRLRA